LHSQYTLAERDAQVITDGLFDRSALEPSSATDEDRRPVSGGITVDADAAARWVLNFDPEGRHNLVAISIENKVVGGLTFDRQSLPGAILWIEQHQSLTHNVYWSLNEPALAAPNDKLTKALISSVRVLQVDIDPRPLPDHLVGCSQAEIDAYFESERQRILADCRSKLPAALWPSVVVDSGGGLQLIWILTQKLGPESFDRVEAISKALGALLGGDAVSNIDRIFRVAWTVNHPNGKKAAMGRQRRMAIELFRNKRTFSLKDFNGLGAQTPISPINDRDAQDRRIREVTAEIEASDFDIKHSLSDLDPEAQAWVQSNVETSSTFAKAVRGDLEVGDDPSGSGHQARLAWIGVQLGMSPAEFACLAHALPHCHGAHPVDARALARVYVNVGERRQRELARLVDPIASEPAGEAVTRRIAANGEAAPKGIAPTLYAYRPPSRISPRRWLHAGHFIISYISVTVAPGGTGKSIHALIDAVAMATGRKLLHDRPHRRCKVWVFNGEDPREEIERRIAAILIAFDIDPKELAGWLFIDSGRDNRMLLATETRDGVTLSMPTFEAIATGIRANGIEVLIIDPFISTHRVKENGNEAIDMIVKELARVADRECVAIELIHHVRKTNGQEVTVEDARGAGSFIDAARSARVLTRMTADEGKRFNVDNHRRYLRIGGDPKSNMTPPPASQDTKWMELKSVSLGNGTPDYPLGDSVGVLVPFKPVKTADEIRDDASARERRIVAEAVINAANGAGEVEVADILQDVMLALHQAQITSSTAPHITREKIIAALSHREGFTLSEDGHVVRLKAVRTAPGPRSPWKILVERDDTEVGASPASESVFA